MSFSTGGLFVNESVEVAKLHLPDEPWTATRERALSQRTTKLPKAASNRRSLREIVNRLAMLSDDDLSFLVYSDRADQAALLWVAVCRTYEFIQEFCLDVIQERFLSGKVDLPLESFDRFFEEKALWHEEIAGIRDTTRSKLRQIMFRMLREADIVTSKNEIRAALLSTRFTEHIANRNKEELRLFPGVISPETNRH